LHWSARVIGGRRKTIRTVVGYQKINTFLLNF
jgi:hypothetical protein